MGMFDTIRCNLELPGKRPAWLGLGHAFQSKSLDCEMSLYTIEADGNFSDPTFTGVVEFYDSNTVGSGPGLYTANGEDAEFVTYEARIVDGKVVELKQTEYSIRPALSGAAQMESYRPPTPEEIAVWKTRQQRPLVGQRLYVLWGGQEVGYWVKVLFQTERQLCVQHDADSPFHRTGELELLDPRDVDRIFWDSEEAALTARKQKQDDWDRRKAEYDAYAASWAKRRE